VSASTRDRELRRLLLAWFDSERRPMPWREAATPYRVWISEIMLQQTQVATVIPYFERFVARYPDLSSLAAADEEELLACWSGLGYYSRARNLLAAARTLQAAGGALPADPDARAARPGVGRYSAGAVASIAFGRRAPALDGNGIRLLTRIEAWDGDPRRAPLDGRLWARLGELVDCERPGDLNQSVMELAARVCRPRSPRCGECPLCGHCRARAAGRPEAYPQLARSAPPQALRVEVGLFREAAGEGRLLLARGERPFLGKLWNLPYRLAGGAELAAERWSALGLRIREKRHLGELRHGITRYALQQTVLEGIAELRAGERPVEYRWVRPAELEQLGLPAFSRKILQRYGTSPPGAQDTEENDRSS